MRAEFLHCGPVFSEYYRVRALNLLFGRRDIVNFCVLRNPGHHFSESEWFVPEILPLFKVCTELSFSERGESKSS
jgi:hypothetical protein